MNVTRFISTTLLVLLGLADTGKAQSFTDAITITLGDVINDLPTGDTFASFGSINTDTRTLEVPYGASNYFSPNPAVRLQPNYFHPGNHSNIFTIEFNGGTLQWLVGGRGPVADPQNGLTGVTNSGSYTHSTGTLNASVGFLVDSNASFTQTNGTVTSGGSATVRSRAIFCMQNGAFAASDLSNHGTLQLLGGDITAPLVNQNSGTIQISSGDSNVTGTLSNLGNIQINNGNLAHAGALTNQAGGTLSISSGRLSTNEVFNQSGGTLSLTGGTLVTASLTNLGALNWSGGTIVIKNDLRTNGSSFLGQNPNLAPEQHLEVEGSVTIQQNRFFNVSPDASLAMTQGTNYGTLYVTASQLSATAGLSNHGILTATAAELIFNGTGLENSGTLNLTDTVVVGDVHSGVGSIVKASDVRFTGHFRGAASFTKVGLTTFEGGYSPGESPAHVTHAGSVSLASTNTLTMELAGTVRGSEYDALSLGGTFEFGGVLEVLLLDDYVPSGSEVFDLFDFSNSSGTFSSLDLPTLPGILSWKTDSLYLDGTISVIPEPDTSGLCVIGLMILLSCRRERPRKSPR